MKKILYSTFVAFLLSTAAFAQNTYTLAPEAEAQCTELTRKMALELRLNEPEYIKLKALNRERMALTDKAMQKYTSNSPALKKKLQQIAAAYDAELTSFLKPMQVQAYASYKQQTPKTVYIAVNESY